MQIPTFATIITAAGKSERFSSQGVKKEYLSIDGQTVLQRATAPFLSVPNCQLVIVTCPKGEENECGVALGDLYEHQSVPVILCDGGESRKESVRNALTLLKHLGVPVQYVAIHDGARCFITTDLIIQTLATATMYGGAAPALPVTDSLKTITDDGVITASIPRHGTVAVQTPQIFRWPDIYLAHQAVADDGKTYTDDTEIWVAAGKEAGVCPGDRKNRKITYMEEIPDAQQQIDAYLAARKEGERLEKADKALRTAIQEAKQS
ncbi:MAG: 2-C-methyl-D-erythritol 4-phosphate cytidylyltransferase [Sphaerochaeta sp.]|jgi:2-C-methyl-D-erythritol 4-phosphate cytidylyltransferase|nr:2-C-methyl-D-erythritol 4-phosphate cytidylyltransferase [Sphaerochaeta sp.]MCH3920147.1 2-C-methyl-D-erythritol 4-phosphate cytidylyltransferase [Sphaerochaeta sp.]MCI2045202.1 2-C-methyl-D-erythritol 4-phosphate cytidylyltransferase [Sphaerochaeta sp.]MCI2076042.1 2-C-methyl-D-erythritol 4-phosphate cytidylyltransferase [Sphaerochaeta sp.]MCI2096332.1 2-C-methyl-D-erythritol 4-phosphate cytidylyltransferase [Sphaerochaeta sp.]